MEEPNRKKIEITIPQTDIKKKKPILYVILVLILGSVIGILSKFNIDLNVKVSDLENSSDVTEIVLESSKIELATDQEITTEIETEDGEIEVISAPVVDLVDGGEIQIEEDELDLGKGEFYAFDTPQVFKDATLGKCIDVDGKWGSQCVDLSAIFWKEYTGRWISTCNTGMAKGIWNCKKENAGQDFNLIEKSSDIQAGDWIVFDGGEYGHIGMALGNANNGFVALLGENQGGSSCKDGGSATNIINISLKNFKGAFRPKIYDAPKAPDTSYVK